MGALAVINGVGRVPATNGVVDDSAIPTTIARDTELPTVNDATLTVNGGSGLAGSGTFTANQSTANTITLTHADTSSQATSNNSGTTFIQDITLDTYGHVTGIGTATAGGGASIPSHGAVGAFGLMRNESNQATWNAGATASGTGIRLTGLDENGTSLYGDTITGTWRNMSAGLQGSRQTTVGLRIS